MEYIGQLELLAAVVAYTTFADELRGAHVIHWIDNESAVYSLVKGYSRAPDCLGARGQPLPRLRGAA